MPNQLLDNTGCVDVGTLTPRISSWETTALILHTLFNTFHCVPLWKFPSTASPKTLLLSVTAATQKKQFISVRIQSTSSKNWDAESFYWLWRLIDQQWSAWKGPNWMNSDHEWTSWLLSQQPKSIKESKRNKQTKNYTNLDTGLKYKRFRLNS